MASRLGFVLVAALAAGVACGGAQVTHVLDAGSAARQISGNLASTFGVEPPPVRCPHGIKVVAGHRFDCTTALDGQALTIHGTVDDDSGRFTAEPAAAVLVVSKIVRAIERDALRQNGLDATVDCGPQRLLVKAPGDSFQCTTRSGTVTEMARVTVQDVEGHARYELAEPESPTVGCRHCA